MFKRARLTARETGPQALEASVEQVKAGLRSMHDHCLTNLGAGLRAMTEGDLTVEVRPATTPIEPATIDPATAELVELFNSMLAKAQGGLQAYNAMRARLNDRVGAMITEIGALAGRVAASSQQMTASSRGERRHRAGVGQRPGVERRHPGDQRGQRAARRDGGRAGEPRRRLQRVRAPGGTWCSVASRRTSTPGASSAIRCAPVGTAARAVA